MKSILSTILFLILNFLTAGNALAAFTGPAIPQAIPFTQNGKTYGAYVQAWHPYYGQSQICYYPTDFNQAYAPIIAKSDVVYGGLVNIRLHLNPASSSQAWDSEAYYTTNLLCARYQNGNWVSSPTTPDNLLNGQYNWGDWYSLDHDAYGLTDDLVRAVGINVKVNATHDFGGQFGLGSYTSGDVVVTGSALLAMKLPLPGAKNWLLTVQIGGSVFCNGGTDTLHTGGGYYSLDFDDYSSQSGSETDVPIYAAASGTVDAGDYGYSSSGYGHWVKVNHGNGYKTLYGHMTAQSLITSGTVNQGDRLGTVGTTGASTGTHLHFQLYYNGSSASTVTALSLVRIEGLAPSAYTVGCNTYYSSTNTQSE